MRDIVGAACSGLCLIHCLMLPTLAVTGTSLIGITFLAGESVHLVLSGAMLAIALASFPRGWRIHKHPLPGALGFVACALVLTALIANETIETYLTIVSGTCFIAGHLTNRHILNARNMP